MPSGNTTKAGPISISGANAEMGMWSLWTASPGCLTAIRTSTPRRNGSPSGTYSDATLIWVKNPGGSVQTDNGFSFVDFQKQLAVHNRRSNNALDLFAGFLPRKNPPSASLPHCPICLAILHPQKILHPEQRHGCRTFLFYCYEWGNGTTHEYENRNKGAMRTHSVCHLHRTFQNR